MKRRLIPFFLISLLSGFILCETARTQTKPKIAVFSGPTSTIQNTTPLVTSNKARATRGLPLRTNPDRSPARFDHLLPQRLAAPVEVLIEQFTAHPLEKDAAELYGPPDGYVDRQGVFRPRRQNPDDKPVYKVTLRPEDGLYLLPYVAVQADGKPWDSNCAFPGAPFEKCRQPFYPDPARIFEEIDRSIAGRNEHGVGNILSSKADFDFYRAVPSGGYTKGLASAERTDVVASDIPPERLGEDFFPYGPHRKETRLQDLARATNTVQRALRTGNYAGAIWLEGSPTVQETTYWLNLLIDTTVPITGNSSQRVHGMIGNEGNRNIVDSVDYVLSKVWADSEGRDSIGAVQLVDTQIFASRQAEKQGARPGGYVAMGGHGGILGTIGDPGPVTIWFKPTAVHTWRSAVNLTRLPQTVQGVKKVNGNVTVVNVQIKDNEGYLIGDAIPKVTMVRHNRWIKDTAMANADEEPEIFARIEKNLKDRPLSGIVAEGSTPYGGMQESMEKALGVAAFSGIPVVRVSRGDTAGMVAVNPNDVFIEGNNLTAGKARVLLMAALIKFGALPPAANPSNPTPEEKKAVQEKIKQYQEVFNTH